MINKFLAIAQNYFIKLRGNKIAKETFWSFMGKASVFVLFLLQGIILARTLGPEKFGTWSLFYSIYAVIELFSFFGINKSARKFVAQYNKTKNLKSAIYSSLLLRVLCSGLFLTFIFVFHNEIASIIKRSEYSALFLLAAPLLFFSGLMEFMKELFQGLHRLKYNFFVSTTEYSIRLLLIVILVKNLDLLPLVNLFTTTAFITSLLALMILFTQFAPFSISELLKKSNYKYSKKILRYSIPFLITSFGFIVSTQIDTIMVGYLSSEHEVGLYSVAKQPIEKFQHIAFAIAAGSMPLFAKYSPKRVDLTNLFNKLLKINTLIYTPLCFLLALGSFFYIPFLYGKEFAQSVYPLIALCPHLLFTSYSVYLSYFLDYVGRAGERARNLIICMTVDVALNLILIPRYGAFGAALSTSFSYLPYVILNFLSTKKMMSS